MDSLDFEFFTIKTVQKNIFVLIFKYFFEYGKLFENMYISQLLFFKIFFTNKTNDFTFSI